MKKTGLFLRSLCFGIVFFSAGLMAGEGAKQGPSEERILTETQVNTQYLLGNVLRKSQRLQEDFGDFSPYGAALFRDGSVKYVWFTKPGEIAKNPMDTLPVIRQALHSQAMEGAIVASAVIYKVGKKTQNGEQLNIELEYQTGIAIAFATEMVVSPNNKVTWGANAQKNYEPKVFALKAGEEKLETDVAS